MHHFQSILSRLFAARQDNGQFSIFDPQSQFNPHPENDAQTVASLNAAFLVLLCGKEHPGYVAANRLLIHISTIPRWAPFAAFYREGIDLIREEIEEVCRDDADFAARLESLSENLTKPEATTDPAMLTEKIWSLFFPEAVGIHRHEKEKIEQLRQKRRVKITRTNPYPISDPAREIVFTSNVLLTLPPESKTIADLPLSERLKEALRAVSKEPQLYWYDHPIQIGVELEKNEVLYGLRGLEEAIEFEKQRGNLPDDQKVTCLLSVSVTHAGLHPIAKSYLEQEILRSGGFRNLNIYLFTEDETRKIVDFVLLPAAKNVFGAKIDEHLLDMFGVDGEYGRHYSFLKAIAAFWQVFIDPEIRGTFKIDLDQVFPQKELVDETGFSAFEHFRSPLWGARGIDTHGKQIELGMIAGALVNRIDINKSLFTPDVTFPQNPPKADEHIFYSRLPQALSTEAEMMTRYNRPHLNGKDTCIQRIHVTGGTNGILIDSLRRQRPFTPSFIGRAEDQAYILSALQNQPARLAYLHQPGLIMRHDKEAFAQEAIQSAFIGKLIGDYQRILYFSAYARALADDYHSIKEEIDPFTGCFISRIPTTVVYLRFALKAATFFQKGKTNQAVEFIETGASRITSTFNFIRGNVSPLTQQLAIERRGWNLFYDLLSRVETGLRQKETFARKLARKAGQIVSACRVYPK